MSADGHVHVLAAPGTPVGGSNFVIGQSTIDVTRGTRVLVFSDGLPEMDMPHGRALGLRRLRSLLIDSRGLKVSAARTELSEHLKVLRADVPLADDVTFAMLDLT
jgi:serine phosphatase RsbU (regulator of sigma subunit)